MASTWIRLLKTWLFGQRRNQGEYDTDSSPLSMRLPFGQPLRSCDVETWTLFFCGCMRRKGDVKEACMQS